MTGFYDVLDIATLEPGLIVIEFGKDINKDVNNIIGRPEKK